MLGLSEGTVKVHSQRARAALRLMLAEESPARSARPWSLGSSRFVAAARSGQPVPTGPPTDVDLRAVIAGLVARKLEAR
jgi:hypothetical protein